MYFILYKINYWYDPSPSLVFSFFCLWFIPTCFCGIGIRTHDQDPRQSFLNFCNFFLPEQSLKLGHWTWAFACHLSSRRFCSNECIHSIQSRVQSFGKTICLRQNCKLQLLCLNLFSLIEGSNFQITSWTSFVWFVPGWKWSDCDDE